MERNLCVPDSVEDEIIQRAWRHLFGNNAIDGLNFVILKKLFTFIRRTYNSWMKTNWLKS